jgi:hypothetical protein
VCVPTLKVMAVAVSVPVVEGAVCEKMISQSEEHYRCGAAFTVVVDTVVLYAPSLIAPMDENSQCCAGCFGVAAV